MSPAVVDQTAITSECCQRHKTVAFKTMSQSQRRQQGLVVAPLLIFWACPHATQSNVFLNRRSEVRLLSGTASKSGTIYIWLFGLGAGQQSCPKHGSAPRANSARPRAATPAHKK